MMGIAGCAQCGADRLKSVPIPIADSAARWLGLKRRYRCTVCGWTGWRHRLRRRSDDVPSLNPRQGAAKPAISLFVLVIIFLLVSATMLARGCDSGQRSPIETGAPQ